MELKEIRQIMELMNKHHLSLFHLEREGFTIKLKKGVDLDDVLPFMQNHTGGGGHFSGSSAPQHAGSPVPHAAAAPVAVESSSESEITSPMVGTLYRSPSPESSPFVKVGDQVSEDTVVCIIEAMKVMNEIHAGQSGVITKSLVEDGSPVQYGQPLFLIEPA